MSASDGYVIDLTKIHDSGSSADRWNLVIVAEGYTAAEISTFENDAQDLADYMFGIAPFDEQDIACAINVYRLSVASDESGADDPACGGAGAGTTAATYFDATYCADGAIRRLLSGDGTLAQDTVEAWLPEWDQIVVLVNAPVRGGAGGTVAWLANSSADWRDVFMHELGHAAFDLADEYGCYTCAAGETGRDNYGGAEPAAVNVSTVSDPATVKWSALVTAGVANPTMPNPDCTGRNLGASPVAAGTVGTFEGAKFFHCGLYRPEYICNMRVSSTANFCAVCQKQIRDVFAVYAAPASTGAITPSSLSVGFVDIPEGTTAIRAAMFTIDSCRPVTLQVTSAPAAPFDVYGASLVVSRPDGGPVRFGYMWFSYTGSVIGAVDADTADINCIETGESWTFNLSATCVERPKAAIQLVLDRSGSMLSTTSEGRTKEQLLRDSASVAVEVAYADTGIGMNSFDHDAQPMIDVSELGDVLGAGRIAARNALSGYAANPDGYTAIGDGIELGRAKLDATVGYDVKAMIVLTDGIETAEKFISEVADTVIDEYVYAIGLGSAEQIQPAALEALTNGTGGYMLMTGNLDTNDTYRLAKYYLQILAGITNNDIVLDPEGTLDVNTPIARIPFDVNEADIEITGVILSTTPGAIGIALETPHGDIIDFAAAQTNPQVSVAYGASTIHMRTSLPLVYKNRAAGSGRWHLLLRADYKTLMTTMAYNDAGANVSTTSANYAVSYSANVLTYSNLRLDVQTSQDSMEPGARIIVRAYLSEYGGPFGGSAQVFAELEKPDGVMTIVNLNLQDDGVWQASITATQSGIYRFRVRVIGTTTRDRPFTREQIRTAAVWNGGDNPGPELTRPDDEPGIRDLICCLLTKKALRPEFLKQMDTLGIDSDRLMACLKRFCSSKKRVSRSPKVTIRLPNK